MFVDSGSCKYFVNPKLIHWIEGRMLEYTEINAPMVVKATGHNLLFGNLLFGNLLFGTAQGILLVLVRDTQDVCKTVEFTIIALVPGLGIIFLPQLWQLIKVSKLFSLRQDPSLTLAHFQFS